MKDIDEIKVPRCIIGVMTVISIRVERNTDVRVYFVQAKTRVASTNTSTSNASTSMSRLESLTAAIGARLTIEVKRALNLKAVKTHYWTDSSTVVACIHRENNWSVFVSNRAKEIKELTNIRLWKHVPGHLNPLNMDGSKVNVELKKSEKLQNTALIRVKNNDGEKVNMYVTTFQVILKYFEF